MGPRGRFCLLLCRLRSSVLGAPLKERRGGRARSGGRKMLLGLPLGASLLLLLHTASRVEGAETEITVAISSGSVMLTCPEQASQWWGTNLSPGDEGPLLLSGAAQLREIERGKELFCGRKGQADRSWKIFLKIKGCQDCVELSFGLGAGIVVADLLLTLGALLLVYFCSKKQQPLFRAAAPRRQQGQPAEQPPPVPNPDYEPIRKGQREVYAGLEPQPF